MRAPHAPLCMGLRMKCGQNMDPRMGRCVCERWSERYVGAVLCVGCVLLYDMAWQCIVTWRGSECVGLSSSAHPPALTLPLEIGSISSMQACVFTAPTGSTDIRQNTGAAWWIVSQTDQGKQKTQVGAAP